MINRIVNNSKKILLGCVFYTVIGVSHAYSQMPVEVISQSEDLVGQRLVYFLKGNIRQSSSLALSYNDQEARLQVQIVTIDKDSSSPGYSTVYSMGVPTETIFPYYLTSNVGYCGTQRVQESAEGLVADISKSADGLIQLFQALMNSAE